MKKCILNFSKKVLDKQKKVCYYSPCNKGNDEDG